MEFSEYNHAPQRLNTTFRMFFDIPFGPTLRANFWLADRMALECMTVYLQPLGAASGALLDS